MARTLGESLLEDLKRESPLSNPGNASIGGRGEHPPFEEVYLMAARTLVKHAIDNYQWDEMVIPCVYLQRHAIELMLKGLLQRANSIGARNRGREESVPQEHDLEKLVRLLDAALGKLELSVPKEVVALASEINAFEDGDPTRLRYPQGVPKKRYRGKSFPERINVPIGRWQSRLEMIYRKHFALRSTRPRRTLAGTLSDWGRGPSDR